MLDRRRLLVVLTGLLLSALHAAGQDAPPAVKPALDHISARSLQGHLTFLASDLLEGRDTPSRGLDLAAEYIAAQFRRSGLEPAANGSYFQIAPYVVEEPDMTGFQVSFSEGESTVTVSPAEATLQAGASITVSNAPVLKIPKLDDSVKLTAPDVQGKVLLVRAVDGDGAARRAFLRRLRSLQDLKPAALVVAAAPGKATSETTPRATRLRLAEETTPLPYLTVRSSALQKLLDSSAAATASVTTAASKQQPVQLRNVAGILRGSDPKLQDTFLLVTSHYDHVGLASTGEDRIFNGANDDGSGTVSVIEIADALARLPQHPKRSILFMTYFGEEKGLLGSRYFGAHPLVPLTGIVGDINLEQLGRTDSPEGSHAGLLQVTGRTFSDVVQTLGDAGKVTAVRIDQKDDKESDAFFSRSDNQALADQGIPAHTVCVAYEFPDYHKVTDSADKIDYENMARVDRTVALAIWLMSENPQPPHWNEANPKTKKYVEAYRKLHPAAAPATPTSPAPE